VVGPPGSKPYYLPPHGTGRRPAPAVFRTTIAAERSGTDAGPFAEAGLSGAGRSRPPLMVPRTFRGGRLPKGSDPCRAYREGGPGRSAIPRGVGPAPEIRKRGPEVRARLPGRATARRRPFCLAIAPIPRAVWLGNTPTGFFKQTAQKLPPLPSPPISNRAVAGPM